MEESVYSTLVRHMEEAPKHRGNTGMPNQYASRVTIAARASLAVVLLLTLVAGSIALPAAASGPMCTLSCCVGRAPHAAGSCMGGSCDAGVSARNPVSNTHHSHHHQNQGQPEDSEPSDSQQPFAGIMASADSEIGEMPTIEAAPYEASAETDAAQNRTGQSAISAAVLSKPCRQDCGLCASGFVTPKRPRNAAVPAGSNHARPTVVTSVAEVELFLKSARTVHGLKCAPRGPPLSTS